MARRKLSTQGRIIAAGLSIGVAGALAGFMAAGDHTAGASQPATASSGAASAGAASAGAGGSPSGYDPYGDGGASRGTTSQTPRYQPQPQTRTGGS